MYPASTDKLQLVYIYDNTSHKDDEMKHDQDVNVSFLEPVGGDWISVAGNAITTTDRSEVAKYYSASTKAWFADLGDGVHDGSGNDPRVSVLKVKPTEVSCVIRLVFALRLRFALKIRYYARKETLLTQAAEVAAKAFGTGQMATPGAIRTITGKEVSTCIAIS
jgi:general stress protein 26